MEWSFGCVTEICVDVVLCEYAFAFVKDSEQLVVVSDYEPQFY